MKARNKPSYLLHKPTGQARVRIGGKDHYLGAYGTPESYEHYEDLVKAWLRKQELSVYKLTVDELALLYLDYAAKYYVKAGKVTSEIHSIRAALRPLVKLSGATRARDFSPMRLKQVREEMVCLNWCRETVNDHVRRIRRMFAWAVENEYVPFECLGALRAVAALKRGKTTARDLPPIQPVPDATVEATLPHLSPIVADMIRLQRLTGMRPAEVCLVRPCDIDRTSDTWIYTPREHKTEHHGKLRTIFIGPRGQAILMPYLLRPAEKFCFSPVESETKRRRAQHAARMTPANAGNRPGSNVKDSPTWRAGERYTSCSYRRAIDRACDKAFPIPSDLTIPRGVKLPPAEEAKRQRLIKEWRVAHRWAPNQLRHTAATQIRKMFGLEAAQVALGHSEANVTQIYAERDLEKAAAIMKQIG